MSTALRATRLKLQAPDGSACGLRRVACGIRALVCSLAFGGSLFPSNAQNTGTLRLFIDPGSDFQFVLDHKYRMQQREVTLAEGPHDLTFWAPKHRMVDTTITVVANTVSTFTLRLPVSAEYMAWQREMGRYKRQVVLGRGVPLAATVGFGAWTVVNFFQYRTAHEQLKDDEAQYGMLTSPRAIAELKDVTIPADKEEFSKQEDQFLLSAGLTVVSAGLTWWMFKRTRGREIPQFEDKEKIKFDGLVWMPAPNGGTWAAALSLPLR